MIDAGSPLCWPSSPEASRARAAASRASWWRCPSAAGVGLDGGLGRGAAEARFVVVGVAHPGCGQLGEHRVQGGAGFGVEPAADRGHAVDVLSSDGQAAAFGPVDVGEVAVGVEAVGEFVSQFGQLIGAVLTGQPGQLRFGVGAGLDVDEIREPVKEAADHRDMPGPELDRCAARRRSRAAPAPTAHRSTPAAHPDPRPHAPAATPRRG